MIGLSSLTIVPNVAHSDDVIDLEWSDLIPEGSRKTSNLFQGIIDHDQSSLISEQPKSSGIRTDWNGQNVRIPGYIVPSDYSGTGVKAFMLVPLVGACVHVPPPPANQRVFVTTEKPFESTGLFEAVQVTGMFGTASTKTQMADVGYALSADQIVSL